MPKVSPEGRPILMSLIEDNPSLLKLISSWPNVELPEGWRATKAGRAAVIAEWANISGVPEFEIRHLWLIMFNNGFITDDGAVDGMTDRYVQAVFAGKLKRSGGASGAKRGT